MKNVLSVIMLLSFFSVHIWSQDANGQEVDVSNERINRPSVALVLSGAGPRGFAHVAIIELIEELGIPIDFVLGTSSGAIVGGLYSAGYSGEELAQTVLSIDWTALLQESTTHILFDALGPHSSKTNLLNIKLDGDLSLNLGGGLLTGQYVYNKLKSLTVKIPSYIEFDDLPVPYRATAVDLVTGELVLFEKGDLAEAMRSSMTLPGVFEPFPIDGRYYLDGFIKNTLPISAVRDLGYDIVIAIEISEKLPEDASTLSTNPISVLNQVLALQQSAVTSQEYAYADIVLFPDLSEFSSADYAFSKEIYAKGKIEAEKFRDDLIDIRSKIFPDVAEEVLQERALTLDYHDTRSIVLIDDNGEDYFRNSISYHDLPFIMLDEVVLNNPFEYDVNMIYKEFEKIRGKEADEVEIEAFLREIYETSNYLLITSRIRAQNGKNVLELDFTQKKPESVRIGAMQTFEGVFSHGASWELSSAINFQFNDFLGLGGVLSIQSTLLSKSGLEILHMQPLTDKVFLRSKINAFQIMDIEHSGFVQTPVHASYFREGNLAFALGIFFSPKHKILHEIGLHWIDSTRTSTELGDGVFDVEDLDLAYSADFLTRYTYNNLDTFLFPSKGFYNDIMIMGVLPLIEKDKVIPFEMITNDTVIALPFNKNINMVLNTFLGTNISQGLLENENLITKYGFTTYDRVFFPHVLQRYTYGIHKIALKIDFQYQPDKELTVLGGQFFVGMGGAVGNVWNDYSALLNFEAIDWQASAFTGLRITESIGAVLRIGAGHYEKEVEPFVSLDFMVKHY